MYADDKGMRNFAEALGMEVVSSWELPLPAAKQTNMFEDASEQETGQASDQDSLSASRRQ